MKRLLLLLGALLPLGSLAQYTVGGQTGAPQGAQPPSYAISAGYTNLVFDDEFSINQVAPSSTSTGAYNWYTYNFATPANSLPQGDFTVSGGYLAITSDTSGYSYGISTVGLSNISRVWQHGYFETRVRFSPTGNTVASPSAWPAFWSFDVNGIDGNWTSGTPYGELDIMECIPSGGVSSTCSMYDTVHQWLNNAAGAQGPSTNNPPSGQSGTTWTNWNVVGALWTTNQVQWYLNGTLLNTLATGPSTSFTGLETSNVAIILGTGPSWETDYDYVRVWH
jgi:hypothetical protein